MALPDETALRLLAKRKIETGALPQAAPESAFAGKGSGLPCSLCEQPITPNEGQVQFELPENAEALYADVRSSLYRRSFSLGGELETGKIEASLNDGVLTVRIPKRAELRPRKIEVQSS